MKTTKIFCSAVLLFSVLTACNRNEGRYLNLTTGEEVSLEKDEEGRMIDSETRKPVLLYVDAKKKDTFYGISGDKVNGRLYRLDNGAYVYSNGAQKIKIDGDEYKVETANAKEKWDADGSEYKYKDGDEKVKADGDGYKIKRDGYTKKIDEDGDVKIETRDKKIKIDGETGEKKVKERSIFGKAKDKLKGD
jgi:hypothetical protein